MIYIFLLDAGVLAVSYFKKYTKCNITALALTITSYYFWFYPLYQNSYFTQTLSFLSVIFILFGFLSILYNFIHKQISTKADISVVIINGVFYFLAVCDLLGRKGISDKITGIVALALAIIYLIFSYSALLRTNREDRKLVLSYLSLTLLFATLIIPIELKGYLVTLGFIIEASILVWLGFKVDYKELRYVALALGIIVIIKMFFFDFFDWINSPLILNQRFLTYLALAAGVLISAYNYRENRAKLLTNEKKIATVLALVAALIILINFTVEITSYFHRLRYTQYKTSQPPFAVWPSQTALYNLEQFSISALWGGYSLILILIGIFRKFRALRLMALVLFSLTIFKVFIIDMWNIGQVWRILSFIALGLVLVITSFLYQKYKDEFVDFVKG